jgi:hypothetical protein
MSDEDSVNGAERDALFKEEKLHLQAILKDSHLVLEIMADKKSNHTGEGKSEKDNGIGPKGSVHRREEIGLKGKTQEKQGDDLYHVVEVFFTGGLVG